MSDSMKIPSWMEDRQALEEDPAETAPLEQSQSPKTPQQAPSAKRTEPGESTRPSLSFVMQQIWDQRRSALSDWKPPARSRVSLRNLAIYTRQLGLMLNSGLSMVKSFELLGTEGEDKLLKKASIKVRDDVLTGKSITAAFSRQSAVFPSFMNFTIQSAEVSGTLPTALLRLATYYEKENLRYQKIRSSLVYPAFVFSFALISFFFIVGYIFPLFSDFFAGLNFTLPPVTRFLFWVFGLFTRFWFWCAVAVSAVFIFFVWRWGMKKPDMALLLNLTQLRFPLIGKLMQKIVASHLCRSLSTMLEAGVFVLAAMEVLRKGVSMPAYKVILTMMQEELRAGESLGGAMQYVGLFPRVTEDMVRVGEESGNLQVMLEKSASYLDLEIETLIENLTALIEPLLIIALGFMVGTILIGLFLPLYQAITQIH